MSVAASSGRSASRYSREVGPPDLPRVRSRDLVDEAHQVGDFVAGEYLAAPVHDLRARDDRPFHGDDAGTDGFTEERVGHPDHSHFLHRRMSLDSSLDFPGIHVETRANDNVLAAADQMQVARVVEQAQVAREEEA